MRERRALKQAAARRAGRLRWLQRASALWCAPGAAVRAAPALLHTYRAAAAGRC